MSFFCGEKALLLTLRARLQPWYCDTGPDGWASCRGIISTTRLRGRRVGGAPNLSEDDAKRSAWGLASLFSAHMPVYDEAGWGGLGL